MFSSHELFATECMYKKRKKKKEDTLHESFYLDWLSGHRVSKQDLP